VNDARSAELFVQVIDAADRFTEVNDRWVTFAAENASPHLTRDTVLGRPLWDFITGEETRQLYRGVLTNVRRTGRTVELPFRCDSPRVRRFLRMAISPLPDGSVRFEIRAEREEPREPVFLLDPAARRSDELVTICAWCKHVRLPHGEWVATENAVHRLRLFERELMPSLSHGMCPSCIRKTDDKAAGGCGG
jgi:hypothetical protein